MRLEDTPSFLNFPGEATKVEYREGLFVGYRYYDAVKLRPLFPFGHGLSYTSFEYSNLKVDKKSLRDTETLKVTVEVKNSGSVAGKEVVQLYVGDLEASVLRPVRELKGFAKVALQPGEKKTVSFVLAKRAFAFWSPAHGDWTVETGDFEISVGSSSADLRAREVVRVESTAPDIRVWSLNSSFGEVSKHPLGLSLAEKVRPRLAETFGSLDPASPEALMVEAMIREMPLRNMVRMTKAMTKEEMESLIDALNAKT
jgi:beta-glucosidase